MYIGILVDRLHESSMVNSIQIVHPTSSYTLPYLVSRAPYSITGPPTSPLPLSQDPPVFVKRTPFPHTVLVKYPLLERHDILFCAMLEER
jgi:hypothetical protein